MSSRELVYQHARVSWYNGHVADDPDSMPSDEDYLLSIDPFCLKKGKKSFRNIAMLAKYFEDG
jgi:hypothetical protein